MTDIKYEDFFKLDMKECPACNGKGWQYSHIDGLRHRCPMCNGKGKVKA